jgi:hypothetical protein
MNVQLAESVRCEPINQRPRAALDLVVILIVFGLVSLTIPWLNPVLRRSHGIPGFFGATAYQFIIEGIAPLALMLIRQEKFADYRFIKRGLAQSLALAVVLAVIYNLGLSLNSHSLDWVPLIRQPATRMALEAGPLFAPFGISLVVLVWGFLEGFFGIYLAQKVNIIAGHDGRGWLSPGVLAFALFNGGVHLLVGQGVEGFITSFVSGYAITVVPAVTGNAWGGSLVQVLTNAAGPLR